MQNFDRRRRGSGRCSFRRHGNMRCHGNLRGARPRDSCSHQNVGGSSGGGGEPASDVPGSASSCFVTSLLPEPAGSVVVVVVVVVVVLGEVARSLVFVEEVRRGSYIFKLHIKSKNQKYIYIFFFT